MAAPLEPGNDFARGAGFEILVKLLNVLSVLGGPVITYDALKPTLGQAIALALILPAPVLVCCAAFNLRDTADGVPRTLLKLGLVAGAVVIAMNAFAAWQLAHGRVPYHAAESMLAVFVGPLAVGAYALAAIRLLRAERR
jgi:hypothetical protein